MLTEIDLERWGLGYWEIDLDHVRIWLIFVLVALLLFWVFSLAKMLLIHSARRISRLGLGAEAIVDKTSWRAIAVQLIERIHPLLLAILAIYIAANSWLELPGWWDRTIRFVFLTGFFVQLGLWFNHVITFAMGRYLAQTERTDAGFKTTVIAIAFIARLMLIAVLILVALDTFGINITTLITGLGIGGIAVALAVQSILGDLIASLSIMFDKPFALGDFIIVGDFLGSVEHIGLKTTRIRSLSGEQLIFSNSDLLSSRIRNYGRMRERRVVFTVGITYDTPPDILRQAPGIIQDIIKNMDKTRFDRSHFFTFADSSLNIETVYYVLDADYNIYMDIQQQINFEIFERFQAAGMSFAFPSRTVYLAQDDPKSPIQVQTSLSNGPASQATEPA